MSLELTAEGSERTDKGDGEPAAEEGDHVDGELGAVGLVCAGVRAGVHSVSAAFGEEEGERPSSLVPRADWRETDRTA